MLPAAQVQSASERYLAELGRHNYVTPTSYLELLSAFRALLESKKAANAAARKRYNVGLEKLASSAAQVAGMQQELVAMQPQLVATVAEVEQLMARIAHDKKVSTKAVSAAGMRMAECILLQLCFLLGPLAPCLRVWFALSPAMLPAECCTTVA
jgi:hypothetical protein